MRRRIVAMCLSVLLIGGFVTVNSGIDKNVVPKIESIATTEQFLSLPPVEPGEPPQASNTCPGGGNAPNDDCSQC